MNGAGEGLGTAADARLLVVDDHPVVALGIRSLLAGSGIALVGTAETAHDAVARARALQPDVILLDVLLPDRDASDVVRQLVAAGCRSRILLFTANRTHPAVSAALTAGAHGCLSKQISAAQLIATVKEAARPDYTGGDTGTDGAIEQLSLRQQQILDRVARGATNREIADEMGLAPNTVKTYWQQALVKLGARNRVEAIARAYEIGLI